jgi:fructokinase
MVSKHLVTPLEGLRCLIEDSMAKTFIIAGIGEVLFDVLPDGKQLGGAPVNFAFHAQQLGLKAYPVCAVGRDSDGLDIIDRLAKAKLSTKYIQQNDYPTGTAKVSLDVRGVPNFTITQNVAWDHIQWTNQLNGLAAKVDAVSFGSLAQRSPNSCRFIQYFLRHTRHNCLRIFDTNLRQEYYSYEIVEQSLQAANVLKLNEEELTILQKLLELPDSLDDALCTLRDRYELDYIAFTQGSEGGVLMDRNTSCDCPGYQAAVIDTVGAGDAYTAVLTFGILHRMPLEWINQMANRVAAYVCSQAGATPVLPELLIAEIKNDLFTCIKDDSK